MAKRILHGIFRSEWSDGSAVETYAKLNLKTGAITLTEPADNGLEDRGSLENEKFIDANGNEYDVCDCCHSFVMKSVMVEDPYISSVLNEESFCSDKYCESNEE
jgi:hypothetical protein